MSRLNSWVRLTEGQQKAVSAEADRWVGGHGRHEKVASVAYCLARARIRHPLLREFVARVHQDQWYVNFHQAVLAAEALAQIKDMHPELDVGPAFERVERNLGLTIWHVNMTYYARLAEALAKGQRQASPLFEQLEHHILSNLDMDYSALTMARILRAFAGAGQGSPVFYRDMQRIVVRGHYFRHELAPPEPMYRKDGQVLAYLSEVFALHIHRGM